MPTYERAGSLSVNDHPAQQRPVIAHLAALTIEYGGVLHTTGRDFAGFRWTNPL